MDKSQVRKIVDDTLLEVFAIDGRLRALHDVHLKPYDMLRIRQSVKKAIGEEYNLEFPEREIKPVTESEFLERMVGFIKTQTQ